MTIDHPIAQRWPATYPDRLQLYSFPTPNGVKVSIALEEMGVPYEAHTVKISGDQHSDEFRALNPNGKIPAIIEPQGASGKAIEDPRPRERYIVECKRLLGVLESQLIKQPYIAGSQYTIADIAIFPWLRNARDFYDAADDFEMNSFVHTMAYLERCLARPAVIRGLQVPPRE